MRSRSGKLAGPGIVGGELALACGLILYAAHTILGLGGDGYVGWLDGGVSDGLMSIAALLCLARVVLVPEERLGWLLIALGLVAWAGGDIYWSVKLQDLNNPPFPSLADVGYLAFYPLTVAGLAALLLRRVRGVRPGVWLDGLIVALAVTAIGIQVLIDLVLRNAGVGGLDLAASLAYPVGDTMLLAFAAALLVLTGVPGRAWSMIVAGLAVTALADALYSYGVYGGAYAAGDWINLLWPLGASLIAAAAWQRSPQMAARAPRGWRTLAIPAGAALLVAAQLGLYPLFPAHPASLVVGALMLCAIVARVFMTVAENQRLLQRVETDPLTGLGNRGKLLEDLSRIFPDGSSHLLMLFDLDGFKQYNDSFGHPAGDSLLSRLGTRLEASLPPGGSAYRIGGDEFCVLIPNSDGGGHKASRGCAAALGEKGDGFQVSSSSGAVEVPNASASPSAALQIADGRMYAQKDARRDSPGSQAKAVLLRVLRERQPEVSEHVRSVSDLAVAVGTRLGLDRGSLTVLSRAAELHDVGKVAIPDQILDKPGRLNAAEWEFMKQHTILGERILSSAPSLVQVARYVRSSHEHVDGSGYPDGLSGDRIPLISRIILACDAFEAMTSDRPYAVALDYPAARRELHRCSGTDFDPMVVEALLAVLDEGAGEAGEVVVRAANGAAAVPITRATPGAA